MLETLVTSKTRRKLLVKFFLNPSNSSYLRDLESEFGKSTNSIRLELNRFEKSGMLKSSLLGKKKIFRANTDHLMFNDIHTIVMKDMGIEQLSEIVLKRLPGLRQAWLTGDIALGRDSNTIELLLVGNGINNDTLHYNISRAEMITGKKINCSSLMTEDTLQLKEKYSERLLLFWELGLHDLKVKRKRIATKL
jgi:hypothetical protein